MQNSQQSLITRDDTLFGVCAALGEDLGFNPNYLRITFGVLLLWNPTVVVGAYVAAGAVVLLSRLLFPIPRAAAHQPAGADPAVLAEASTARDRPDGNDRADELAIAA